MKINLVYHTLRNLGSGYMGSEGLRQALERNGYLDYAYNTCRERPHWERLQSSPILYIRGFLAGRIPSVARAGNQFKATWQSESYYTRRGDMDISTPFAVENQQHFNLFFVTADTDLDKYEVPTVFLPSWADTSVLDEYGEPEYEGLGFIGGTKGREDFLDQDTKGIINIKRTNLTEDATDTTREYARLISKFKYLVSPPGRCFTGMCGRTFEIMACKRLCFAYYNPDTMFRTAQYFRDGVDLVYFRTFDELVEKFNYYKDKPGLCAWIAENGYRNVRENHNENVRAKYIVNCMYDHWVEWRKEQDNLPDWMREADNAIQSINPYP